MEFTETVQAVRDLTSWVEEHYPKHKGHLKLVEDKANGPAVLATLQRTIPGPVPTWPRIRPAASAGWPAGGSPSSSASCSGSPS